MRSDRSSSCAATHGRRLAWLCALATLCGCRTAGFYTQAIHGQYQIVAHEQKIEKLLADPQTPAPLKAKLQLVQSLRAFAANVPAMVAWGLLIVLLVALGFATWFAGLVVVVPVIGHATWHAYRELVA